MEATLEQVEAMLRQASSDLDALGARWAVVGGLAMTARTRPRYTDDVDFAVAVADDKAAESLVYRMCIRGYAIGSEPLEQDYTDRLSTVRLIKPVRGAAAIYTDLLFASSGIENEIARDAERLTIIPGLKLPVATVPHLIAIKVLAGRAKDLLDLAWLVQAASESDLAAAKDALKLITKRGYNREKDLMAAYDDVMAEIDR
jgi:predicted nucleotidyltransferase